jgi:hypothetical protein
MFMPKKMFLGEHRAPDPIDCSKQAVLIVRHLIWRRSMRGRPAAVPVASHCVGLDRSLSPAQSKIRRAPGAQSIWDRTAI